MNLEHGDRLRWVREISNINQRSNAEGQNGSEREDVFA
jgi:hypothetical protein